MNHAKSITSISHACTNTHTHTLVYENSWMGSSKELYHRILQMNFVSCLRNEYLSLSLICMVKIFSIVLGSMVSSVAWNDQSNILAGMQDGRFTVWYHPTVVYTDKDLLAGTICRRGGK